MKIEKLVVSCQALPGDALYGGDAIIKIAKAVIDAGASAIRTNDAINVKRIKQFSDIPIIALIKQEYEDYEVYITPTTKELDELAKESPEWIAIDATHSTRPVPLNKLVSYSKEKYPNIKLLADISTFSEAQEAQDMGFDAVATTMFGYSPHTKGEQQPNFDLLRQCVEELMIPVIAEGNFNTPELASKALKLGASAVVVGSAITRPQFITRNFLEALDNV